MSNQEIKINLEQIEKEEQKLQQLEAKIRTMSIIWKVKESEGAMVEALHAQAKEINMVAAELGHAIRKTIKQVSKGRKKFEQTDKEQANKILGDSK